MPESPYKHSYLFTDLNKQTENKQPFASVSAAEVNLSRYPKYFYNMDNEELYAQQQGTWDKAKNGLIKMAGLAGSTIVNGTLGLANGIGKWMDTGEFSSLYDNPVTRSMDEWNKEWEDQYAHYYTQAQKNAAWWESENLFDGNMLWDKVVKNMGFAAGAALTGWGFSAAMKGLGITAGMMKAGQGLEALAAIDEGIIASTATSKLGSVLNSLTNTSKGLGRPLGKALSSGSASDALTAVFASTGEASLEALHNANEYRETLISQFKTDNLRNPNEEELKEINQYAASVGKSSFALNMGLLTATQYIQLPKIFSTSVRGEKAALNEFVQDAATQTYSTVKKTGLRGAISKTKNALGLVFSPEEAFEESAQYSITKGTQDYYDKKYRGEDANFWDSLGEGVKEGFLTEEGLENLFLGGLSGGLMTSGFLTFGKTGKIAERGLLGEGGARAVRTETAIKAWNESKFKNVFTSGVDAANRAITIQEERVDAIRRGSILEAQDAEQDFVHNYLFQRIKYGKEELIAADIAGVREKAMTDAGFLELQETGRAAKTDTKEQFLNRLSNLSEQVKDTTESYKNLKDKYENIRDAKGNPVYTDAVMEKLSYAASKIRNYNKRINTLSAELTTAGVDTNEVVEAKDIATAKESLQKGLASIQALDKLDDNTKADLKQKYEDVAIMSELRKSFLQEYNDVLAEPVKAQEVTPLQRPKQDAPVEEKEKVVVPTKTGDKEIEVGEEYFLGRIVEYDAKGNEVYRMPTLRILGENADGTIRIQDASGKQRDIKKEVLGDYKLGKVSALKGNKTASYYYRHMNDVYKYNFGKDFGGEKSGRIWFDPENNKLYFVYKDAKGKIQNKEINNTHLVAQEGYTQARLTNVSTLKAESVDQKSAREEFTSEEELKKSKEDQLKNRDARISVVAGLAASTKERLEQADKKLVEKQEQLKKINEDLQKLYEPKTVAEARTKREKARDAKYPELGRSTVRFNRLFSTTSKALLSLTRLKQATEDEIAELSAEKEELEFNLSYFQDFTQNIGELSENSLEFFEEIKAQTKVIEDLVQQTVKDISLLASMSKDVTSAIKELASFLRDAIAKFDKDYPQYIKDSFERIIKSETILTEMPILKDYLADYALIEDTQKEISFKEGDLVYIQEQIDKLADNLKELDKQLSAKAAISKAFEEVAAKYKAAKAAEKEALENKELHEKFFKSQKKEAANSGVPSIFMDEEEQAKEQTKKPSARKPIEILFSANVLPTDIKRPSDKRLQTFLSNIDKLPQSVRANIKRIFVTANNEEALGLKGVTELHLEGYIPKEGEELILSVFVSTEEDGTYYINAAGEKLGKLGEAQDLNSLVWGAMPSESLEDSYGARYTEKTPLKIAKEYQKEWIAKRKSVLQLTDSIFPAEPFYVSSGIAEYEVGAKNPIVGTLITKEQLNDKPVLKVSTTGTVVHQGRQIKVPVGRVVVSSGGTFQIVNNRNLVEKEVDAIFKVLKTFVAKANKEKVFDSKMVKFLQGVLFFESPYKTNGEEVVKNKVARNQFYFHKGNLYFGENEVSIPFTTQSIELQEKEIKAFLKGTYNNVNNTFLSAEKMSTPFVEFYVDEQGELAEREWPNYQSYLLSTENRTKEEIPLSTTVRMISSEVEDDSNFRNRYTYNFSDLQIEEETPKTKPTQSGNNEVESRRKNAIESIEVSEIGYQATIEDKEGETITITADTQKELKKKIADIFNGQLVEEQEEEKPAEEGEIDLGELVRKRREKKKQQAKQEQEELDSDDVKNRKKKAINSIRKVTDGWIAIADDKGGASADEIFGETEEEVLKLINKKYNDELGILEEKPTSIQSVRIKNTEAEKKALAILNNYAEPSSNEIEYQGDEIQLVEPDYETADTSTIGKIVSAFKSFPPVSYNLTSNTIEEFKQKVKAVLAEFGLEDMSKDIISNINKLVNEQIPSVKEKSQEKEEIDLASLVKKRKEAKQKQEKVEEDEKEKPKQALGKSLLQKGPAPAGNVIATKSLSPSKPSLKDMQKAAKSDKDESQYRVVSAFPYAYADLEKEKQYIQENTPFPVKIVENLIDAGNGFFAFGSYLKGVITLSEKMEVGTGYHEMFEGVYDAFLSSEEKGRLLNEFKSREGFFTDRETGSKVAYKDATTHQAKEQLAEEFRDKKLFKLDPPKAKTSFIKSFFNTLENILNWLLNKDNVKSISELFERMDSAYYKNAPYKNVLSSTAQNRLVIGTLDVADTNTVIKNIVSRVFQNLFQEGKLDVINELDFSSFKATEVYENIYRSLYNHYFGKTKYNLPSIMIEQEGMTEDEYMDKFYPVWENIDQNWELVKQYAGETLRTFKIIQDLEQDLEATETDYAGRNSDSYLADAFSYDSKKNAPASVKLLIATIQESAEAAAGGPIKIQDVGKVGRVTSLKDDSTGLERMVDYSKTFNYLLENLSSKNTLKEKEAVIKTLAKSNPNFVRLYNRLQIDMPANTISEWALKIKFYSTFAKQKPIALIQYNQIDGTSTIGEADIFSTKKMMASDWLANIKQTGLVTYSAKLDKFILDSGSLMGPTNSPVKRLNFLKQIGIVFLPEQVVKLTEAQEEKLSKAITSIKTTFRGRNIDATSLRTLDVAGPLNDIFDVFIRTKSEAPESTFVNIEGERVQQFIQSNAISRILNDINDATTKQQLLEVLPHLNGSFANDSVYVNKLLFDENGNTKDLKLVFKYIQGTLDLAADEAYPMDKLSRAQRLQQVINQNLAGNYYMLLPADSKTEFMLGMENLYKELNDKSLDQFYAYYQTEQDLGGSEKRLFKFLGPNLTRSQFDKDFSKFVQKEVDAQFLELYEYNILKINKKENFEWVGLDRNYAKENRYNSKNISEEQVKEILTERTLNFIANNTEIHKLFFGDPAEYADPTKRYKSFMSPREQSLYNTPEFDEVANETYNQVDGVALQQGDPGYQVYSDVMKTVTQDDIYSEISELPKYDMSNGTDAQGVAHLSAYKQMRIKNGFRWSEADEAQFQYEMAMDRLLMEEDGMFSYENRAALKQHDKKLTAKGDPKKASFSPLKPIATGFYGETPILDKYSIYALTYRMSRGRNISKQYKRMLDNNISYIIEPSGRKVGVRGVENMYNKEGDINTAPYQKDAIIDVPFKWFGIQVETLGEHSKTTTGSQLSKLATVNLLSAGLPIDYEGSYDEWYALSNEEKKKASKVYSLVMREREIKELMIETGYQSLLNKVGINPDGTVNNIKLLKLIKDELSRREINDNIRQALKINPDTEEFDIPIEALNNYDQIKNVIFSYLEKFIAKPKVNGGPKIQVSGSGWEFNGKRIVAKTVKKKGKDVTIYTSTGLKFYTKEDPYMEVLLPAWFGKKLAQLGLDPTDPTVLSKLDKEILTGIGFRIPTQELNSVEAFRVAGFLPESAGDMIVVPEAITTKAGSDFDVDKLNTYLKNVYISKEGIIKAVPFFESKEKAINYFSDEFFGSVEEEKESIIKNIEKTGGLLKTVQDVVFGLAPEKVKNKWSPIIRNMIGEATDTVELEDQLQKSLESKGKKLEQLSNEETLEVLLDVYVEKLYKESIENEYFKTLEQLVTLPENFDRLTTPNSSDELLEIRDTLVGISEEEFGDGGVKSILSPVYMNNLRHNYLLGKGGVSIAAVAQVNSALMQKDTITIEPNRILSLKDETERKYIGNGSIALPHNTVKTKGKTLATLSLIKDQAGRYISDKISQYINGFVDVAKDPFLVQMGVTRNNASTFLLLERLGVPSDVVAFFMNQPIIREYNKYLSKQSSSYPFISDNIDFIKSLFPAENATSFVKKDAAGLAKELKGYIQDYYGEGKKGNKEFNSVQHFILDEYLKYSVISSNLFRYIQSTTYDTANFTNPYLLERKFKQTEDVQNNNIFSSVNSLLKNTMLGKMRNRLMDATAEISNNFFKFLNEDVQPYFFPVIVEQAERKGLNDADFLKVARKVEQSFISYLIQNSNKLTSEISTLLVKESTSVARQVNNIKNKAAMRPNSSLNKNPILRNLMTENIENNTSTKVVKIFNKATDAPSQNILISALEELKDNPVTEDLYESLIKVAFLQSGISTSPISFTELIPVEDFKKYLIPAINSLSDKELLKDFIKSDSFYRNSWADPNSVPTLKEKLVPGEFEEDAPTVKNLYSNFAIEDFVNSLGMTNFRMYKVSTMSKKIHTSNFAKVKFGKGKDQKIILLKKLTNPDGTDLTFAYSSKIPNSGRYSIYYPVNAWGDGIKGQEYYRTARPSVFDNGTIKFSQELSNQDMLNLLTGNTPTAKKSVLLQEDMPISKTEVRTESTNIEEQDKNTDLPCEGGAPF
jgi:hypothetical protein